MLTIFVKFFAAVKSLFTPTKIKWVIAIVIIALLAIIYFLTKSKANLENQLATLTFENTVISNNLKVANEKAVTWQTKDSIDVVTNGLMSADDDMLQNNYADLNKKFNDLILDNNSKVQKNTYLEAQIYDQDSIILKLKSRDPGDTTQYADPNFIANDSTIHINELVTYDSSNFKSLIGDIEIGIDSNKIKNADVKLKAQFGLGIAVATYTDKDGISRVSVGTKFPDLKISVSGITDIESQLNAIKNAPRAKSSFGVGISLGYGYIIGSSTTLQRGIYCGVGVSWVPNFLRFNK